tara:strand:+ start:107 stop:307 length:201 start_codon:yes stop_codon:yes gene_type:complete
LLEREKVKGNLLFVKVIDLDKKFIVLNLKQEKIIRKETPGKKILRKRIKGILRRIILRRIILRKRD